MEKDQHNYLFHHKTHFLSRLEKVILDNLLSPSFCINELCRLMGMSRMHLHRKIKKATGRSTSNYIRHLRLEYSKVLLKTTDLQIAEIAYTVGFSYPSYFTLCFVAAYGKSPKKFRK